jgi:hypothetical protein
LRKGLQPRVQIVDQDDRAATDFSCRYLSVADGLEEGSAPNAGRFSRLRNAERKFDIFHLSVLPWFTRFSMEQRSDPPLAQPDVM